MKHKHAELIIAWANGAKIQHRWLHLKWEDVINPNWDLGFEYRIKPEPKPDIVRYAEIDKNGIYSWKCFATPTQNIKYTFDGETGKLKSAEVL
jgi:hypothetical protein